MLQVAVYIENDASFEQNDSDSHLEIDNELRGLDSGGMIKSESKHTPGLTPDHFELIYQTEGMKLYCGLCAFVSCL